MVIEVHFTKYESLMREAPHQGCHDPLNTSPACHGNVPTPAVQFSPRGQTIRAWRVSPQMQRLESKKSILSLKLFCTNLNMKWAILGLFFHLLSSFQTNNLCNKLMRKNVHLVYGAEIRTHDLQSTSLLL